MQKVPVDFFGGELSAGSIQLVRHNDMASQVTTNKMLTINYQLSTSNKRCLPTYALMHAFHHYR